MSRRQALESLILCDLDPDAHASQPPTALIVYCTPRNFENLLFSICWFYELEKKFPRRITVIDFESSRARFEKLHLNALRFPREKLTYIGHGNTIAETDLHKVYSLTNLFQQDPYGCRGELSAVFFERC